MFTIVHYTKYRQVRLCWSDGGEGRPGRGEITEVVIANTNGGRGVAYPKLINCQVTRFINNGGTGFRSGSLTPFREAKTL